MNSNEKGVDGFIKASDGKSYYFRLTGKDEITSKVKAGLKVSFIPVPSNKPGKSENAIKISEQ